MIKRNYTQQDQIAKVDFCYLGRWLLLSTVIYTPL